MEWLDISMLGFLVVFLATIFLIGELLVKAKGIFGIIGVALITLYFSHHIGTSTGLWVIIVYAIGLLLILVDGKLIGDGTVSLLGAILMIIGLAIPAPSFMYAALVGTGALFGGLSALLFMKVFPRRDLWSKMTLKDKMTSEEGYNSINESYGELVGKEGTALSDLRPTGTIEVEGKTYSATTGALWVEAKTPIRVTEVDGTRILVAEASQ